MIESKTHLFPPPPCDESARVVASPTSGCAGCCPLLTSGCAAGCPARLWGCAHCCQPTFWGCSSRCPVCKHCLGFGSWAPLPPERYPCWEEQKLSWLNRSKAFVVGGRFTLLGVLYSPVGPIAVTSLQRKTAQFQHICTLRSRYVLIWTHIGIKWRYACNDSLTFWWLWTHFDRSSSFWELIRGLIHNILNSHIEDWGQSTRSPTANIMMLLKPILRTRIIPNSLDSRSGRTRQSSPPPTCSSALGRCSSSQSLCLGSAKKKIVFPFLTITHI